MENAKKVFSRIGISYLSMEVIAIVAQILIVVLLLSNNPDIISNNDLLTAVGSLCQYIIPLPFLYLLIRKIDVCEIKKKKLSAKAFLICIAITVALMYIGNLIGLGITELISILKHTPVANPISDLLTSANIWTNLLLVSLLAPVFEELFFRKLLIDRTIKYGSKISIFISALMFGLFHGNLNQFFYAFLIGGFFATVYVKTGNVKYTMALHITANIVGSVISLIVEGTISTLGNSPEGIVLSVIYYGILFIVIFVGLYYLMKWSGRFKDLKDNIKKPVKTSLLNVGMVLFILYFLIEIINTTLG